MILSESLKRDYSFAYHRTNPDNIESIAKHGFKPGWGDMYGKGWYLCYDLDSQLQLRMTRYGLAIVKAKIDMKGVLVLDYSQAKKIFGSKYTLVDQALEWKIYPHEAMIPNDFIQLSIVAEETLKDPVLSAVLAAQTFVGGLSAREAMKKRDSMADRYGGKGSYLSPSGVPRNSMITGIVFSGNHDGNVLVSYAHDTSVPVEYCITDHTAKIVEDWAKVDAREIAQKRADTTRVTIDIFQGKIKRLETNLELSHIQRKFPWLLKADYLNATVEITNDEEVIWKDGLWKRGEWYGDLWLNGEWKSGKWHKGIFAGGIWNAGNFLSGSFGSDLYPQLRADWKKGTWTLGTFNSKQASWKEGDIVRDGVFMYSKEPPQ